MINWLMGRFAGISYFELELLATWWIETEPNFEYALPYDNISILQMGGIVE